MFGIKSVRYTRNLFLRAFCTVYLAAFLSLYFQAPGLYGDNGILPARHVLENSKHNTLSAKIHYQPTLLWLAPYVGLSTSAAIDVLSLLGAFLAFTGIVSQKFCIMPIFTALWSLYFSLFQIGQEFVKNRYDEFLLEAGFLAIFVAPLTPGRRKAKTPEFDMISLWLCRWLLFRFLFTAGMGKLLSGCPKWWSLSALSYHFETMPLPSPLSWYAHHLPPWILRLSTMYANVCELIVPCLFFVPSRLVGMSAFYLELFLQLCIILTGNFDHANILVVTLLLTLLDDRFFYGKKKSNSDWDLFDKAVTVAVWVVLTFAVVKLYKLKYSAGILDAEIAFTKTQFNTFVGDYLFYLMGYSLVTLAVTLLLCSSYIAFHDGLSGSKRAFVLLGILFYWIIAFVIFFCSTAPLSSMHPKTNVTVPPYYHKYYNRVHKARILNDYNLFPKITGADGRPEIIFEGSDNLEGPWKEYNFLYKPGNVNHSLPFVAPYSPRLDWQLYWAVQSSYEKHPWVLSLAHRLLTGVPEVLDLIDKNHSPFSNKPPKYVRGVIYKYRYTPWSQRSHQAWWIRERVGEYFSPHSKDSPVLEDFLKARSMLPSGKPEKMNPIWKQILSPIRFAASKFEGTLLFWSVLSAALAIVASTSKLS